MARPKKIGLEYFPLDCQMDDKIAMLEAEHGLMGFAVYIKLLQHIYQTENGELDMTVVFRWKTLGKQLEMSVETLKEYLETMFAVGLLERDTFAARQVLTSSGVQKRRNKVAGLREKDRSRKADADSDAAEEFSDGKPPENPRKTGEKEKESKRKVKEDSNESSQSKLSIEGAGEPEKKIGSENPADLAARTPAPTPPVAPAPHSPEARRAGTYRDFDTEGWPAPLHPPFETPAFHAAWAKWGKYLAEIGKPHRGLIHEDENLLELRQLANGSHELALTIISKSISTGWKSLNIPTHATATANRPAAPGRLGAADGGVNQQRDLPPAGSTQRSAA